MVALVRLATINDCNKLGPRLRDADKHELKVSCREPKSYPMASMDGLHNGSSYS